MHGVLVSIDGVGVLILGEAGSGKSECALKLLSRGHKLVADDVVEAGTVESKLFGEAPIELRGSLASRIFGIIDVVAAFGTESTQESSPIDVFVDLDLSGSDSGEAVKVLNGITIPGYRIGPGLWPSADLYVETAARLFRMPDAVRSLEFTAARYGEKTT